MTGMQLFGPLPEAVEVQGRAWAVRTDFRVWLRLMTLMAGPLAAEEKLARALALCYPAVPGDLAAAAEGLAWFFRCGAPAPAAGGEAASAAPCFSPEEDAALLVAAFQQAYAVDLTEEGLHWWRFRALLEGLPDGTQLRHVMSLRAVRDGELRELDPAMRRQVQRLRARYRLKGRAPEALSERDRRLKRYVAARLGEDGKGD